MSILRRLIDYTMTDKNRLELIVKHLKDNPNRAYHVTEIAAAHDFKMTDEVRNAIWDMVNDGIILWFPSGEIQYNQRWMENLVNQ